MQKVEIIQKDGITSIDLDREEELVEETETARKVGSVTLKEELGRGAFAIVYKGYDSKGQQVAVKEIPRSKLSDKLLGSLRKEVSILKSLDCKYTVKLHNVIKTPRHFYLVMEYCDGGDLGKLVKKYKRLEEHAVQNVVYQIGQGLKVLHENRIVHRDLKLSNFLLKSQEKENYIVKIADFGFATVLAKGQDAETFCGTAPNMAPEVLSGSKYNEKADLWSMGTVIFYMITGSYPFEGKHPIKVMENIKKGKYTIPKDLKISKMCLSLINGLLQVNPDHRLSFEEFFNHPFVWTDPGLYLNQLRALWGEDYGLNDPLKVEEKKAPPQPSPQRHYEKSELLPPQASKHGTVDPTVIDYEMVDPNEANSEHATAPIKRSPAKEHFNPFLEEAMKDDEQTSATKTSFNFFDEVRVEQPKAEHEKMETGTHTELILQNYKKAALKTLEEAGIIQKALAFQKNCITNAYDNIKFILIVNLLKRAKDLIMASRRYNLKHKQYAIIYADKLKKRLIKLPPMELDKEAIKLIGELLKTYIGLMELLKSYAFILFGINKARLVQEGIEYAARLAKMAGKAEKAKNMKDSIENYKAGLAVVEILIDECYVSVAKTEAVIPAEYYRVIEMMDERRTKTFVPNMKVVRAMLTLRKLIRERLQRLTKGRSV